MFETRIRIEEGQGLALEEMSSNVTLTGWDEPDIWVRLRDGLEEDLTIEQTDAALTLSARVSCELRVPSSLAVKVREVKANLVAKGVTEIDAEQVRGHLKASDINQVALAEVYGHLKANTVTSLRVAGTVFGHATLRSVAAADLQNVRGHLRVRVSDRVRASRISGNLQAKEIGGALDVDQVGGNALLKDVAGAVTLDQVAGNLVGKNLTGGAKVPKVGGNLALNGELGSACTYHFYARGNAALRLAEDAGAHLTLKANGHLKSSLSLADATHEEGTLSGTLGDGGAEVAVEAAGNVVLGGGRQPFADVGKEISRQVEESLRAIDFEAIEQQVKQELEAVSFEAIARQVQQETEQAMSRLQVKLEGVDWERVGLKTQHAVERAMERMRKNMDRVVDRAARQQEKLERKLEREARRQERLERKRQRMTQRDTQVEVDIQGWEDMEAAGAEEAYGAVEPEPDWEEERLSILRMVEQGQITPAEAEMLLDALQ